MRRVYRRCDINVSGVYAGVATLIKTTPVLFNIVRYLGAFYLHMLYCGKNSFTPR